MKKIKMWVMNFQLIRWVSYNSKQDTYFLYTYFNLGQLKVVKIT